MTKLIGLAGSLRRASHNAALLRLAAATMPAGNELIIASIDGIPLYNSDDEQERGLPASVVRLKSAIADSDGLVIATPEYNNGVPGVLKNAIDWLSRPAGDIPRMFGGKPIALCSASAGQFGGVLAQAHWLPVLRHLGAAHWSGSRLVLPRAHLAFDAEGGLKDPVVAEQIAAFFADFLDFVARRGSDR